jgi:hypothetical protein
MDSSKSSVSLLIASILFVSIALNLRSHGFIFFAIFTPIIFYIYLGLSFIKDKRFFIFYLTPLGVFIASKLLLCYFEVCVNWQFFNIYKFLEGVNWYEINYLITSQQYNEYNVSFMKYIINVFETLVSSYKQFFVVFSALLALFFLNPDKFTIKNLFLIAVGIFLYASLVSPGISRGFLPLYFILILLVFNLDNYINIREFRRYLFFLLYLLIIIGASLLSVKSLSSLYSYKNEVNYMKSISFYFNEKGIQGDQVFTDDFNLYLDIKNPLELKKFGGWTQLHPVLNYDSKEYLNRYTENKLHYLVYRKNGYISGNMIEFLDDLKKNCFKDFDNHVVVNLKCQH